MSADRGTTTDGRPDAFGDLLRHWRNGRRLSQLALAEKAGVSARHLCHLETGRSRPSRSMVRQLGDALELPLSEQNALHVGAGFAPPFDEGAMDGSGFERARDALDFILRQQNPYPALVLDGHWDIRLRNEAAQRLFEPFRRRYDMDPRLSRNALHVVFHPGGLRPFVENWAEFATHLLRLIDTGAGRGSARSLRLIDELRGYPQVDAILRSPAHADGTDPLVTLRLRHGDRVLAFFSTFTHFAMPRAVALQELKVETLYAADAATETCLRRLMHGPAPQPTGAAR